MGIEHIGVGSCRDGDVPADGRSDGGVQAWKIVVPAAQTTPNPRRHDGFEWPCVLSGRLRVVLGDRDLALGVGEAVEFDTQAPHRFGSAGEGPVEVLSIFGRPGERVVLRGSGSHARA